MLALTLVNLKMLARNRQTTFWALFFPLVLVVVFGLFDFNSFGDFELAVVDQAQTPASRQLAENLAGVSILQLRPPPAGAEEGRQLVAQGKLDYLALIPPGFAAPAPDAPAAATPPVAPVAPVVPVTLVTGRESRGPDALVESIIRQTADAVALGRAAGPPPDTLVVETVGASRASYFDLVLLGLVGMGIMTNAIISIAVRISNYRNLSILKRLLVTPLSIWKFFAAEVAAQLLLALVQAAIILAVGVFVFQAELNGNLLYLAPVVVLGSLVFLNIGFILSAWANSPAAASGMGNAIAFPMMLFAGTFFSTSSLPWLLPYAADLLPLAPMLSALREIALHQATLGQVWPQLAILAGWVAATSLVAVRVFRFS